VSLVAKWLASGAVGGALAVAGHLGALGPVLVIVGVLGGLTLLLIILLALVAVYSPHRARREDAEKILDRLLSAMTRRQR
jgi:hypothetical protein